MFRFLTHDGANKVTVDQLAMLPVPVPMGARHKPTSHIELVTTCKDVMLANGIDITAEEYAIQDDGKMLFFAFDTTLRSADNGRNYSIIGRNSVNERLAWRLVLGTTCLICDNLAMLGDVALLYKKNTLFLSLRQQLCNAVAATLEQRAIEEHETARRKAVLLTDETAKAVLFDIFANDVAPARLLEPAARLAFGTADVRNTFGTDGQHSLWSIQNVLTDVAKALKPAPKYDALKAIDATFRRIS